MLVFVKLGGSLITDKRVEASFRGDVMKRVAAEIAAALDANPDLRLIVGHGSGSFGHFEAQKHGTIAGVHTAEEWRGFARVETVAAELNTLVTRELVAVGVPVFRVQPSASIAARDGVIESMALAPIQDALAHGLVPLVYGDVAFDVIRGGTIVSTETIFFYLAQHFPVKQILLLGEVDGVYGLDGKVIDEIVPSKLEMVESALSLSSGVDVTGGMDAKVRDMVGLVSGFSLLTIRIFSGQTPELLLRTLNGTAHPGTLIRAD